jgi:hypothetical protein
VTAATERAAAPAPARSARASAAARSRARPGGAGPRFTVGPRVTLAAAACAYDRRPGDPVARPLRVYTADPTASRFDGAVAKLPVPYEPLAPGPVGAAFAVDAEDGRLGVRYRPADLDDPAVLLGDGHAPSGSDPRFHQQMVYAVAQSVYATFRRALGRQVAWGFEAGAGDTRDGGRRLVLRPFGSGERNAYYDKHAGVVSFGYFEAPPDVGGDTVAGGWVFTSLSHDVVAHEVTHALLDGIRAHFAMPTGPDVLALHEGFADLVALFQRFSYPDVVRAGVARCGGELLRAELLTSLARQFGEATGAGRALRSAVDEVACDVPRRYDPAMEPHALGSVLVSAVFEAFATVFRRKTARFVRLATGGSGVLPPGEMPPDLQEVLAGEATQLARQFLDVCVRAVDFCPPVDVTLGEYLRAVITADAELWPADRWGYREAWARAFRRRGLIPAGVSSLDEAELRWRPPARPLPPVAELAFSALQFRGDPARPASADELLRQAEALGNYVTCAEHLAAFGLVAPDPAREVDAPCVESIRTARRAGPDGQVVFDLVAEVTQRRTVDVGDGRRLDFVGGATVILGPEGEVRYAILKRVDNDRRLQTQRAYVAAGGARLWDATPAGGCGRRGSSSGCCTPSAPARRRVGAHTAGATSRARRPARRLAPSPTPTCACASRPSSSPPPPRRPPSRRASRRGVVPTAGRAAAPAAARDTVSAAGPRVTAAGDSVAGEYLTIVGGCNDCHTPGWDTSNGRTPPADRLVGSPVGFRGPWGTSYAANLRRLAARVDENRWVGILTTADHGEGRPPMPWMNTAMTNPQDLRAMYRYVRSLGAKGDRMPRAVPAGQEPTTPYVLMVPQQPKGAGATVRPRGARATGAATP